MEWIYFTLRSITPAQRGERALKREGVSCILTRTPRWMEPRGCSYALKLKLEGKERAEEILKQEKIPWQRLYACDERGRVREL